MHQRSIPAIQQRLRRSTTAHQQPNYFTSWPTIGYLELNFISHSFRLSISIAPRPSRLSLQSLTSVLIKANARATSWPANGYMPATASDICNIGSVTFQTYIGNRR
eukprot:GHUV01057064.1.p1 GENE.GHUV01057064.1~~GHUV01057064.1.p1  ORF type:complete len:106 (-),score=8.38 GHUV01057064.1:54-371(-)